MRVNEILDITRQMQGPVYYSAEQTDRYDVGAWGDDVPSRIQEENLLSLRVFNADREIRLSRTDIGQELLLRDTQGKDGEREYYDEWQWLDVDAAQSEGTHLVTTGGGSYAFPLAAPYSEHQHPAVQIRYYLAHQPQTGLTYISDWRCVTFAVRGENDNGGK